MLEIFRPVSDWCYMPRMRGRELVEDHDRNTLASSTRCLANSLRIDYTASYPPIKTTASTLFPSILFSLPPPNNSKSTRRTNSGDWSSTAQHLSRFSRSNARKTLSSSCRSSIPCSAYRRSSCRDGGNSPVRSSQGQTASCKPCRSPPATLQLCGEQHPRRAAACKSLRRFWEHRVAGLGEQSITWLSLCLTSRRFRGSRRLSTPSLCKLQSLATVCGQDSEIQNCGILIL